MMLPGRRFGASGCGEGVEDRHPRPGDAQAGGADEIAERRVAGVLDGARLGHIRFDKMKRWVMQERNQRVAAKQQRVEDRDLIIGAQQL